MEKHDSGLDSYACQFCGKLYMTKISLHRHEQVSCTEIFVDLRRTMEPFIPAKISWLSLGWALCIVFKLGCPRMDASHAGIGSGVGLSVAGIAL